MAEDDGQMKRVLYRAQHRGTKEMDLVLGGFAAAELHRLAPAELLIFEELLGQPDPDINAWVFGAEPPARFATVLGRIRRHHGLQGEV
jgi:antitoxin CptB